MEKMSKTGVFSMKYLLDTTNTIPEGVGFPLFGAVHLIWLGLCLAFVVGSCMVYRNLRSTQREKMRIIFAVALVADELFKYAILTVGHHWLPEYLPFHLCSVNIFLIALHCIRPTRLTDNFLYTVCIPGALSALLFPNWTPLPFPNLMHIHSFTVHALLVAYPVMLTFAGEIRPSGRYVPKCLLLMAVLGIPGMICNLFLDTNFMFLMYAAPGNPLYIFEQMWGNHLLGLPVLIAAVVLVMHGPRLLFREVNQRRHSIY